MSSGNGAAVLGLLLLILAFASGLIVGSCVA
jgi:hypothetical protein